VRMTSRRLDDLRLKQEEEDERLNALRYSRQQQLAQVTTVQSAPALKACPHLFPKQDTLYPKTGYFVAVSGDFIVRNGKFVISK